MRGVTPLARHAVLLGFVFAMVFGHAPIILPALARVRPLYSAWARVPIWILSASLVVRGAGLASGSGGALALAGAGHAAAIAWFAAVMLIAVGRPAPGNWPRKPRLRVNESRLSYSTAAKPSSAQRSVHRPTIRASARRFAGVRMSSSHSPQAPSTTGSPRRRPLTTSSASFTASN